MRSLFQLIGPLFSKVRTGTQAKLKAETLLASLLDGLGGLVCLLTLLYSPGPHAQRMILFTGTGPMQRLGEIKNAIPLPAFPKARAGLIWEISQLRLSAQLTLDYVKVTVQANQDSLLAFSF